MNARSKSRAWTTTSRAWTTTLYFLLLGGGLPWGGGCASTPEVDRFQIARECRLVLEDQMAAWNDGDLEGFVAGYAQTTDLMFVGERINRGHRSLLERYRRGYPDRASMGTLRFLDLDIRVFSPDSAFGSGEFWLDLEGEDRRGRFTLIFRREPEGMRIVYDHTSEFNASPGS